MKRTMQLYDRHRWVSRLSWILFCAFVFSSTVDMVLVHYFGSIRLIHLIFPIVIACTVLLDRHMVTPVATVDSIVVKSLLAVVLFVLPATLLLYGNLNSVSVSLVLSLVVNITFFLYTRHFLVRQSIQFTATVLRFMFWISVFLTTAEVLVVKVASNNPFHFSQPNDANYYPGGVFFHDANWQAGFILLNACALVYLGSRVLHMRILAYVAATFIAFFLLGSRIAIMVFAVFLFYTRDAKGRMLIAGCLLLGAVVVCSGGVERIFDETYYYDLKDSSINPRLRDGLEYLELLVQDRAVLFGKGLGSVAGYAQYVSWREPGSLSGGVPNVLPLQILMDFGVVGLVVCVGYAIWLLRRITTMEIALTVFCTLLFCVFHNIVFKHFFWVVVGILAAVNNQVQLACPNTVSYLHRMASRKKS